MLEGKGNFSNVGAFKSWNNTGPALYVVEEFENENDIVTIFNEQRPFKSRHLKLKKFNSERVSLMRYLTHSQDISDFILPALLKR